jgi:hypothetical protein
VRAARCVRGFHSIEGDCETGSHRAAHACMGSRKSMRALQVHACVASRLLRAEQTQVYACSVVQGIEAPSGPRTKKEQPGADATKLPERQARLAALKKMPSEAALPSPPRRPHYLALSVLVGAALPSPLRDRTA